MKFLKNGVSGNFPPLPSGWEEFTENPTFRHRPGKMQRHDTYSPRKITSVIGMLSPHYSEYLLYQDESS